jgi:hypothetical protein
MTRIAYLASRVTLPGSPFRRRDAFEHDRMMAALRPAFASEGLQIDDRDWADPTVDWASYEAVLIGTCWDYWDRPVAFVDTLRRIERATRLFNSADLVAWNSHKSYLKTLEARGARLIPTLWIDSVTGPAAAAAFATLGDDLVFKRQVGAGADGQHRIRRGEDLPDMPQAMMVQPFLRRIQTEGELSFIFIDGAFSHALLKQAAPGDYRIQSSYGGVDTALVPEAADLAAAEAMHAALGEVPLYARIDMLRDEDGALLLMELELIEPYLYPLEGPELGPRLAAALVRRLGLAGRGR